MWAAQGLPENGKPGSVALYACALVAMNSLGSWAGPACNNPAFADIVPPHMRNLVFAIDRCFEGAVAACAAPLVGMLAEKRFGFKVSLSASIVFYCSPCGHAGREEIWLQSEFEYKHCVLLLADAKTRHPTHA